MVGLIESDVEQTALDWLERLGWRAVHGPIIAPDGGDHVPQEVPGQAWQEVQASRKIGKMRAPNIVPKLLPSETQVKCELERVTASTDNIESTQEEAIAPGGIPKIVLEP
jgi:hypothetical protein